MKKPKNEMKYRELRKLMGILERWGNILVPGGKTAHERLNEICTELTSSGMTVEEIDEEIHSLID